MKLCYSCAAIALFALGAANPAFSQSENEKKLTQQEVKCEKPFTKIDADDNGLISKEEADDAIDRSFKQLDIDRDGRVTRAEYSACHEYSELYAQSQNAFEWFQQADTDQDKSVSMEEMAAAGERDYASQQNGMSKEEHARQFAWNFRKLDKNNNRTIDFSEWRGTPVAEDVLPGDRDQDQAMNLDEWRAHMQEGQEKAQQAKQTMSEGQGSGQVSSQASSQGSEAKENDDGDTSVWLYYLYVY